MNIQEATKKAMEIQGEMCRDKQKEYGVWIRPTDTRDCCLLIGANRPPRRYWNPTAADLMADDWIVREQIE